MLLRMIKDDLILEAWKNFDSKAKYIDSFVKFIQGATELYAYFVSR